MRAISSGIVAAAFTMTWLSPGRAAARAPVETRVSVYEDAGVAQHGIVTVGIPFARAEDVRDPSRLEVIDAHGARVDSEAEALARWDAPARAADAPLRMALLRFSAEAAAHGTAAYRVRVASASASKLRHAAAEPLLARRDGGAIVVDTGAFTARFDATHAPMEIRLAAPGGDPVRLQARELEIEENGRLSATIVSRGETSSGYEEAGGTHPLQFEARWEFLRGEAGCDLTLTLTNPDRMFSRPYIHPGTPRGKRIGLLEVVLPGAASANATVVVGGAGGARARPLRLDAGPHDARLITTSGTLGSPRAEGWIASLDTSRRVSVLAVRDFRENAPASLVASPSGALAAELFPASAPPVFFQGSRAKTWEIGLRVAGDSPERLARAALAPLRAAVDPRRFRETVALGPMSVADPRRWPDFEATVAGITRPADGIDAERAAEEAFGWLDYGDTMREGSREVRRFGNNEFDFGGVLLRLYLRDPSHPKALLHAAHAALRHLADVDVLHTDDDAAWVNHAVHKHDSGDDREHEHKPDFSHFWIRGLLQYWLATGDARSRDVAVGEVSRWITEREEPEHPGVYVWADELRDVGWLLVAIDDLYDATGDAAWQARARRLVHATVLPNVDAAGTMANASFLREDRGWFAPWQQAYVADGLGRYCLAARRRGDRDPGAEAALRRMLAWFAGPEPWIEKPVTIWGRRYPETLAFSITKRKGADVLEAREASMTQALADPFVWGWLLFEDPADAREASRALAHLFPAGPEVYWSPSIRTPAKSCAIRLYFGEAERWREQTSPGAERAGN